MILEFSQGTIKVIPGLEKSSITIRPDSSVVIDTDGSITISAKSLNVTSTVDVSRYSDPAYLKTLGPITAQGIATTGYVQTVSPGILMNAVPSAFAQQALVSALDAGEKVRTEKLDVRTRSRDELLAHSGGLEKVGEEPGMNPMDYAAFVKAHNALAEVGGWGNAYPQWEDDPVAKLYKGTLEAPSYIEGTEDGEIALEGRLNDYYASAVLSEGEDEMKLFHSLQYLLEIGEDVDVLLEGFDPDDIGPASSYMFALVQEHRRQQEQDREDAIESMHAETEVMLERGRLFIDLLDRVMADPGNEELLAELAAFHKEQFGDEVLEPFDKGDAQSEEPELECSDYYPKDGDLEGAMKALLGSVHRNIAPTEKQDKEIPFAGAPVTAESVTSALDALGRGHFAKFNDPVHGYRGFWEGVDTLVDRGVKTFNDYVERSSK